MPNGEEASKATLARIVRESTRVNEKLKVLLSKLKASKKELDTASIRFRRIEVEVDAMRKRKEDLSMIESQELDNWCRLRYPDRLAQVQPLVPSSGSTDEFTNSTPNIQMQPPILSNESNEPTGSFTNSTPNAQRVSHRGSSGGRPSSSNSTDLPTTTDEDFELIDPPPESTATSAISRAFAFPVAEKKLPSEWLHDNYPNIVPHNGRWYRVSCAECGANARCTIRPSAVAKDRSQPYPFFLGLGGLKVHCQAAHALKPTNVDDFSYFYAEEVSIEDVQRIRLGGKPVDPIVRVVYANGNALAIPEEDKMS